MLHRYAFLHYAILGNGELSRGYRTAKIMASTVPRPEHPLLRSGWSPLPPLSTLTVGSSLFVVFFWLGRSFLQKGYDKNHARENSNPRHEKALLLFVHAFSVNIDRDKKTLPIRGHRIERMKHIKSTSLVKKITGFLGTFGGECHFSSGTAPES